MLRKDRKENEPNILIQCACGCGSTLLRYDKYDRERKFILGHGRRGSALSKIWQKVNKTGDCWEWIGAKTTAGYGSLTYNQKRFYAHRFIYKLVKGKLEKGFQLLHKCDNPACVRPSHLMIGNPLMNCHDKLAKGRATGTIVTNNMITEMRRLYATDNYNQAELANKFIVSQSYTSRLLRKERRSDVSPL